jgi:YVTN family beta-propeller protein
MKIILLTLSLFVAAASLVLVAAGQPDGGVGTGSGSPDANATGKATPPEFQVVGHPTLVSPHVNPIAISGDRVFVANTPADTVDVIDVGTKKLVHRIPVEVDPGIQFRTTRSILNVDRHGSTQLSDSHR